MDGFCQAPRNSDDNRWRFDNQHRAIEAMAQIAGPSDAEYAYRLATHVKETKRTKTRQLRSHTGLVTINHPIPNGLTLH